MTGMRRFLRATSGLRHPRESMKPEPSVSAGTSTNRVGATIRLFTHAIAR